MNAGVIYFNTGTRCLIRLLVSLYSLRRCYAGPACVLSMDRLPRWAWKIVSELDTQILYVELKGVSARTAKASLWRYSPYETSLFLDADTVVLRPPEPLLALIDQHGFLVTRFADWRTDGPRIARRIQAWRPVADQSMIDQALAYGQAVNTGVVGWRMGSTMLRPWERITRAGWAAGCTRRMIDELACQILLPRYPHLTVDDQWNHSVCYGHAADPAIVHYHGGKHTGHRPRNRYWKEAYWQLRNCSRFYEALGKPYGDRSLGGYLRMQVKADVTIVTVVNRRYEPRLRQNWPVWMTAEGLREQRFLVIAIGRPQLNFLKGWHNVRIVHLDGSQDTREGCLAAFVFGSAQHVQTDYWMKLDCDARPVVGVFEWPDYRASTLTGHRWGYTRVKGDPQASQHWLNTLDDWWGEQPLFPAGIPIDQRYAYPRINSFCCIEKTSFTRRLAERCADRLPVPSQDTTAWYAALRWGEPIARLNMKRWIMQ